MLDMLTALLWREPKLSVTGSCQARTMIKTADLRRCRENRREWAVVCSALVWSRSVSGH